MFRYVRMVRLLLRTPERMDSWQRHVDDFRGDDDFTAADLVNAAETLFSARCAPTSAEWTRW